MKYLFVLLSITLFSCASKEAQKSERIVLVQKAPKNHAVKKIKKSKRYLSIKNIIEKRIGKPQACSEMAEVTGNKCYKGDSWFSKLDSKNGYAKLSYPGDGYLEYFLFRGEKRDLVVYVEWACGPICSQKVTYFSYKDNQLHKLKKENVISSDVLNRIKASDVIKFPTKGFKARVVNLDDANAEELKFSFVWDKSKSRFE